MENTPWSTVGYLTYKRTYARRLEEDNVNSPTEEWEDTIHRCLQAIRTQLDCNLSDDEEKRLRSYMLSLKGTVAGRFLWQLGTKTVDSLGLPSLQNCAACVVDEPVRPFTWCMDRLMLGCGVGYNIQREYVYKLPKVKENFIAPVRYDEKDADFILPDTREGWVKLLEYTLRSAFYKEDSPGFSYSTQLIRGKGAPIKGFGGVSSGPEILCKGISQISEVIAERAGKQLRPIDCLDVMNIIGSIVVAGNVRRSAQIAIGDPDDFQYLRAKNWSSGNIPNWRSNSNNSVVCSNIDHLPEQFWKTYEGGSEPYGLINLRLSRSCGRIGDTQYKDKGVIAYNPCVSGDTLVETEFGPKSIKALIENHRNGIESKVWSYNLETKSLELNSVLWGDMTRKDAELIQLHFDDGTDLKLTPDHRVYTENRGYIRADDLTSNDILISID